MIGAFPVWMGRGVLRLWKWLRRVPWQVWALLALTLAVVAYGQWSYGRGQDEVQARWDAQEAAYALQRAEAAIEARNVEARHRAEYRAIADRFLKEQADAEQAHAGVIAGLRAGTLRVRQRLTCPAMPGTAADSTGAAETGERGLQPADAELALGIAARADAVARQLNALIEAVKAGR